MAHEKAFCICEDQCLVDVIDLIYPTGSIYLTINPVNPSTLFPNTTWEAWGAGKVPVGVDTSITQFNTVEKTGGEINHMLTTNELPDHVHGLMGHYYSVNAASGTDGSMILISNNSDKDNCYTEKVRRYQNSTISPHNNLQPYVTCYMWKRVS